MKLPFVEILQKWKARTSSPSIAAAPVARIEKPASERFGKTVTPNAARGLSPELAPNPSSSFPAPIALPESPTSAAAPKTISIGSNGGAATERTIALQLAEIIPQIPRDLLKTVEVDTQRRILLKASDLERGMAAGRPTVLLRAVYQQAPEIFNADVSATDSREVLLPIGKVLGQVASSKVRGDQVRDSGSPLPPLQSAPAETKPEPKIQTPGPIRLPLPKLPNGAAAASSTETPTQRHPLPARPPIAPKIPPNGTGAPATERVPASGGPSVLTLPAVAAAVPALPKISLKIAPQKNALTAEEIEPVASSRTAAQIRLPLRAVLRGIPPFQLDGAIDEVPAAAQIELPFSIIEPQLSLGRIAISPAQFQTAMPQEYRRFFKLDEGGMPVSLPLPEVLRNLPNELLRLRGDQVETEIAESFETPFSQKAAEDAARLKVPGGPIAKAAPSALARAGAGEPHVDLTGPPQDAALSGSPVPATRDGRTALQVALETDDALDAKSVVAHASRLPGVRACAIVLSDGLSLAGNIPAEYEADALCAIAPSIVRRINDQMLGAHFGPLQGITLFCAKTPVSFFAHGNICLAALHSAGEIAAEIRARLNLTAQELARMYAQPA
jgi:predicted regulator of Ras-like GTPase activity (Roadblock/LC7/MglB family)